MSRMTGKRALVTGAASGIGRAICQSFAREGAGLVITDINTAAGEALAAELGAAFVPQNVTEEAQWDAVIAAAEQRLGGLDTLINNAGCGALSESGDDPEHTPLAHWRQVMDVNLQGVFLGCRAALPAIRRAGGGAIVNLSSVAAVMATPFITAYGASKAGVRQLTMSVAQYGAQGRPHVRCNSLHPGQIMTPMLEGLFERTASANEVSADAVKAEFLQQIPMGEFGEPEDVAAAALYLASDEARYITGTQLFIDGGMQIMHR